MTEKLNSALKGFRLRYPGKVAGGSPRGEAGRQGRLVVRADGADGRDQRPFRMKRQMAAEEAAWHALTFIQVHREGKSQNKSDCLHFCCRGPQCMHERCNLFRSHYILLFMSSQAEAKITGPLRLYSLWQPYSLLLTMPSIRLNNPIHRLMPIKPFYYSKAAFMDESSAALQTVCLEEIENFWPGRD